MVLRNPRGFGLSRDVTTREQQLDLAPGTLTPVATAQEQQDTQAEQVQTLMPEFAALSSYLTSIGLGSLFTMQDGQPGGWLWQQVVQGITTEDELLINLQQTTEFQERFPVIAFQQQENAAGRPTLVMRPDQILAYEEAVVDAMRRAGMPTWFYDNRVEDVQGLMMRGLSPDAIIERVNTAYEYVAAAPVEVRQKFDEFYGAGQSDAALAAYILDPARTLASLERAQRSATVAGLGQRLGVGVSQQRAERIADMGVTESSIQQGLTQVAELGGLYQESVGEVTDITQETGLESVFEGSAAASTALERRRLQRQSVEQSGQGGATLTREGVLGL